MKYRQKEKCNCLSLNETQKQAGSEKIKTVIEGCWHQEFGSMLTQKQDLRLDWLRESLHLAFCGWLRVHKKKHSVPMIFRSLEYLMDQIDPSTGIEVVGFLPRKLQICMEWRATHLLKEKDSFHLLFK